MTDELGKLSARYESGGRGSKAIGWDTRGGASYGRFQIATAVGTMDRFLDFCSTNYPDIFIKLNAVRGSMRDRHGEFARTWVELAGENLIQDAEYKFIKASHYDAAYNLIGSPAREMVDRSRAMREVLWSTAVQHGASGASRIFDQSYNADAAVMINRIYRWRAGRLSRLTPAVREAVLNRYENEKTDALAMLRDEQSRADREPEPDPEPEPAPEHETETNKEAEMKELVKWGKILWAILEDGKITKAELPEFLEALAGFTVALVGIILPFVKPGTARVAKRLAGGLEVAAAEIGTREAPESPKKGKGKRKRKRKIKGLTYRTPRLMEE